MAPKKQVGDGCEVHHGGQYRLWRSGDPAHEVVTNRLERLHHMGYVLRSPWASIASYIYIYMYIYMYIYIHNSSYIVLYNLLDYTR